MCGYYRILTNIEIPLLKKTLELNGLRQDTENRFHLIWTTKILKKPFYANLNRAQKVN
jgi:hypothetical protein